jgi:hypothetical protein
VRRGAANRTLPRTVLSTRRDRLVHREQARSLVDLAATHGVELSEFQLDFDCPQKNLSSYRAWLRVLRKAVQPLRFVITVLPAWLDEAEFLPLVRETDGYVLQVHSVPTSTGCATGLCETGFAREWVAKAAKLGLPFSVALPTYRCTAGYDRDGKLLGVAMDSVQPSWPPRTRILEFAAGADDLAALVNAWQNARPPQLRGIIWYRLPVASDVRNWRWATLSAVMSGRKVRHRLEILQQGENPIDLSIANIGEADEQLEATVTATWKDSSLVAADALPGWIVDLSEGRAVFTRAAGHRPILPPGGKCQIGWLRYEQAASLRLELAKKDEAHR